MENWNRNLYINNYGRNNALKLQVVGGDTWGSSSSSSTAKVWPERNRGDDQHWTDEPALRQAKFNIINLSSVRGTVASRANPSRGEISKLSINRCGVAWEAKPVCRQCRWKSGRAGNPGHRRTLLVEHKMVGWKTAGWENFAGERAAQIKGNTRSVHLCFCLDVQASSACNVISGV